ncbi:extracellular solute-binding protein [bacterium]|nr:extracellular solute-binding protein [bacterium]
MSRTIALAVVVLFIALCVGCQPGAQNQAPTTGAGPLVPGATPQQAGGKVTLQLWTIWNTSPRQDALADIITAFQAANPDIAIQTNAQEPDAYKTNIRVALGGAQPPDIFFVWSGEKMLHNFVRGGNVADLTADLDASNKAWRSRLVASSLDSYTYDGKTYGVPYLLQCTFFLYNKDLFAKNGWKVPQSWDELLALCDNIKAKGLTPLALGNMQKWPASHFPCVLTQRLIGKAAAERQYDPLGPGSYDDPAWTKSLDTLKDMADKGCFSKAPNGVDRAMARTGFYSGKAAMFYTGTWDFARLSKGGEAPESFWNSWDFFNFPPVAGGKGEQNCLAGSADGYVISSKTPNRAAAVKFLQFMTEVQQAQQFVSKCQELVQVQGAVTAENAGPRLRKYADIVKAAPCLSAWTDTLMEESVAQAYMGGIQNLLEGKKTPSDVMTAVRQRQRDVKRELQAKGQ